MKYFKLEEIKRETPTTLADVLPGQTFTWNGRTVIRCSPRPDVAGMFFCYRIAGDLGGEYIKPNTPVTDIRNPDGSAAVLPDRPWTLGECEPKDRVEIINHDGVYTVSTKDGEMFVLCINPDGLHDWYSPDLIVTARYRLVPVEDSDELKKQRDAALSKVEELRDKIDRRNKELGGVEDELAFANDRIAELERDRDALTSELKAIKAAASGDPNSEAMGVSVSEQGKAEIDKLKEKIEFLETDNQFWRQKAAAGSVFMGLHGNATIDQLAAAQGVKPSANTDDHFDDDDMPGPSCVPIIAELQRERESLKAEFAAYRADATAKIEAMKAEVVCIGKAAKGKIESFQNALLSITYLVPGKSFDGNNPERTVNTISCEVERLRAAIKLLEKTNEGLKEDLHIALQGAEDAGKTHDEIAADLRSTLAERTAEKRRLERERDDAPVRFEACEEVGLMLDQCKSFDWISTQMGNRLAVKVDGTMYGLSPDGTCRCSGAWPVTRIGRLVFKEAKP